MGEKIVDIYPGDVSSEPRIVDNRIELLKEISDRLETNNNLLIAIGRIMVNNYRLEWGFYPDIPDSVYDDLTD